MSNYTDNCIQIKVLNRILATYLNKSVKELQHLINKSREYFAKKPASTSAIYQVEIIFNAVCGWCNDVD